MGCGFSPGSGGHSNNGWVFMGATGFCERQDRCLGQSLEGQKVARPGLPGPGLLSRRFMAGQAGAGRSPVFEKAELPNAEKLKRRRHGPPGGGKSEIRNPRAELAAGSLRRLAGDWGERMIVVKGRRTSVVKNSQ